MLSNDNRNDFTEFLLAILFTNNCIIY